MFNPKRPPKADESNVYVVLKDAAQVSRVRIDLEKVVEKLVEDGTSPPTADLTNWKVVASTYSDKKKKNVKLVWEVGVTSLALSGSFAFQVLFRVGLMAKSRKERSIYIEDGSGRQLGAADGTPHEYLQLSTITNEEFKNPPRDPRFNTTIARSEVKQ